MCGDDTDMEIPVPIPNTEVKHVRAEGSFISENKTLPRNQIKLNPSLVYNLQGRVFYSY